MTNIPDTIYIDLDDTLVEFTEEVCEHFTDNRELAKEVTDTEGKLFEVCGINEVEFYELMCETDFWANLRFRPNGERLLETCLSVCNNVVVMTALPKFRPHMLRCLVNLTRQSAAVGKIRWLTSHGITNFTLVSSDDFDESSKSKFSKAKFASPSKLLIDDRSYQAASFTAAGGQAILVPQPWNDATGDVIELVKFLCNPIDGVDNDGFDEINAMLVELGRQSASFAI